MKDKESTTRESSSTEELYHFVVCQKGELAFHEFMSRREDGRFASIGGISRNLCDYLEKDWPISLDGRDKGLQGIFIRGYEKGILKKMLGLAKSDLYGSERCWKKMDQLRLGARDLASPYLVGGGGYQTLNSWIEG